MNFTSIAMDCTTFKLESLPFSQPTANVNDYTNRHLLEGQFEETMHYVKFFNA